jgi:flavin prenyltransferase
MIAIYCLCACFCGYLAAAGGCQRFADRVRKFWGTAPTTNRNTAIGPGQRLSEVKQSQPPATTGTASNSKRKGDKPFENRLAGPPIESTDVDSIQQQRKRRIIVAMTGATGTILGIRLLEKLRELDIETHLVISKWAEATITYETDYKLAAVRGLATKYYSSRDVTAAISSGSFTVDAMIVIPCSMKTLSSIAAGYGDDLISRAADVTFKERRKLILVARETPFSGIHLENMLRATRNGAVIFPPVPAFYVKPKTVDDIVAQSVGRILDLLGIDTGVFERWSGMKKSGGDCEFHDV